MEKWKTTNPAVALVNARLTNAGHDMGAEAANPAWYGLHRQRAEQLAFAMLPVKHHRDAPRIMAEHLHWLGRAPSRWPYSPARQKTRWASPAPRWWRWRA